MLFSVSYKEQELFSVHVSRYLLLNKDWKKSWSNAGGVKAQCVAFPLNKFLKTPVNVSIHLEVVANSLNFLVFDCCIIYWHFRNRVAPRRRSAKSDKESAFRLVDQSIFTLRSTDVTMKPRFCHQLADFLDDIYIVDRSLQWTEPFHNVSKFFYIYNIIFFTILWMAFCFVNQNCFQTFQIKFCGSVFLELRDSSSKCKTLANWYVQQEAISTIVRNRAKIRSTELCPLWRRAPSKTAGQQDHQLLCPQ